MVYHPNQDFQRARDAINNYTSEKLSEASQFISILGHLRKLEQFI